MFSDELFWEASIDELKKGYTYITSKKQYTCIMCGISFAKGKIYPFADELFDAERAVEKHIEQKHISCFDYLLNLDKRYNGLSDLQKNILTLMSQGASDDRIAREMGNKSSSTIRNHRFNLREKYKEAKIFIAIMEQLEEGKKRPALPKFIHFHKNIPVSDDRIMITEDEQGKILAKYVTSQGKLVRFPKKEKEKLVILQRIMEGFENEKRYTEKEVNELLKTVYQEDYVTLRRYLIEYRFMDREADCSAYWVKE